MSKYSVKLSQPQRESLEQIAKSGKAAARKILHAQILLKADKGEKGPAWPDGRIAEALGVSETMMLTVRKRFVQEGLDAALNRRQPPGRPQKQKLDGEQEAQVIAMLCTQSPPAGAERWTLRVIARRVVELEIVESVSYETIRKVLKKTNSSPGKRSTGASAPKPTPTTSITWKTS